jgi:hypothetical protein
MMPTTFITLQTFDVTVMLDDRENYPCFTPRHSLLKKANDDKSAIKPILSGVLNFESASLTSTIGRRGSPSCDNAVDFLFRIQYCQSITLGNALAGLHQISK